MSAGAKRVWQTATLAELTSSTRPICYGVLKPGDHIPGGVPLVRIVDIKGDALELASAHRISGALDAEFSRSRLRGGEVLLSIQGTIGRVAIASEDAAGANISRTIALIDPDGRVGRRFLRYWLLWMGETNQFKVGGTTRDSLNISEIRSLACPIPSLEEQRVIVEILEDHLSRLDAAVAGVTAVKAKAEVLRRGLLRDAFTGALTGGNEAGLETPDGWVVRSLDEINDPTRPICYGILMPGPDFPDGIPYVKVRNIKGGRVLLDGVHRTTPEIESKYSRSRLRTGDLLVSIRGTYGRTAMVPVELDGGNITQDTARVAPVGVDPSYVLRFLDGPQAQSFFKAVARGVAVKGVNIGDLRKLPVPVPSAEEQRVICDTLDEQLPRIDAVLAAAAVAETRAKALRRSLLHAAFRGDLTREWRERRG